MITAGNRSLFNTFREAERREVTVRRTAKTEAGARIAAPDDTLIDPMIALGISEHQCRHVTELHMGKKGISKLHPSFLTFPNLEELWLNENRLKRVVGLLPAPGAKSLAEGARGCARLKRLYLSGNLISSLDGGDTLRLAHLEVLQLANNRLANLELVSSKLKALRFLRQLDLFGNPLAEEQNYRLYLIHHHPTLELLDRKTVTDVERRAAEAHFSKRGRMAAAAAAGGPCGTSVGSGGSVGAAAAEQGDVRLSTSKAKMAKPVAFGSHLPGSDFDGPSSPHASNAAAGGGLSSTAKLVEAKVKNLHMKQRAALELERQREDRITHARMEKMRLFHSLWPAAGAKGGTAAAPAAKDGKEGKGGAAALAPAAAGSGQAPNKMNAVELSPEAARSSLFDPNDTTSAVAQLIELARQRELAVNDERRAAIDVEIAKHKAGMMPPRFDDSFACTADKAAASRRAAVESEYNEQVLRMVFTTFETDAAAKAFGNSPVTASDGPSLLKLMAGCENVSSKGFGTFFSGRVLSTSGHGGGRQQNHNATVSVSQALRILADYEPFLNAREALFSKQAQASVVAGSGSAAASTFRNVNFIQDHMRRVARGGSAARTEAGHTVAALYTRPGARDVARGVVDSDDD